MVPEAVAGEVHGSERDEQEDGADPEQAHPPRRAAVFDLAGVLVRHVLNK